MLREAWGLSKGTSGHWGHYWMEWEHRRCFPLASELPLVNCFEGFLLLHKWLWTTLLSLLLTSNQTCTNKSTSPVQLTQSESFFCMGNHFSFHLAKRKLRINFSFPNFHRYQLRVAFIPLSIPVYLPAGLSYEKRTRVLVLSQPARCICFAIFYLFFTMVHSQALCIGYGTSIPCGSHQLFYKGLRCSLNPFNLTIKHIMAYSSLLLDPLHKKKAHNRSISLVTKIQRVSLEPQSKQGHKASCYLTYLSQRGELPHWGLMLASDKPAKLCKTAQSPS